MNVWLADISRSVAVLIGSTSVPASALFKSAEAVLERNRDADKPDELRAGFEKLQASAHKLAEAMYKAQQAEATAGPGAGPGAGGAAGGAANEAKDEKVVDAEFEDVTDSKSKKTGSGS